MIPLHTTPPHATGVFPGLQQAAETHKADLSTADLFGLGFVLIVTILVSRQLALNLYKQYQLHRIILSLQRRATLERQLHRKAASKSASSNVSQHP